MLSGGMIPHTARIEVRKQKPLFPAVLRTVFCLYLFSLV